MSWDGKDLTAPNNWHLTGQPLVSGCTESVAGPDGKPVEVSRWHIPTTEEIRRANEENDRRVNRFRSGVTRPGLTELQEGVMQYVYAFGAGMLCGVVVGIVLAVIGGVGLAAWWRG